MIYVLMIVTLVHNGSVVAMQEFNSKDACEAARAVALTGAHSRNWAPLYAYCLPK